MHYDCKLQLGWMELYSWKRCSTNITTRNVTTTISTTRCSNTCRLSRRIRWRNDMKKLIFLLFLLLLLSCKQSLKSVNEGSVDIINLYSYVSFIDYSHIYGEVQNNRNVSVKFVNVEISYKTAEGKTRTSTQLAG